MSHSINYDLKVLTEASFSFYISLFFHHNFSPQGPGEEGEDRHHQQGRQAEKEECENESEAKDNQSH